MSRNSFSFIIFFFYTFSLSHVLGFFLSFSIYLSFCLLFFFFLCISLRLFFFFYSFFIFSSFSLFLSLSSFLYLSVSFLVHLYSYSQVLNSMFVYSFPFYTISLLFLSFQPLWLTFPVLLIIHYSFSFFFSFSLFCSFLLPSLLLFHIISFCLFWLFPHFFFLVLSSTLFSFFLFQPLSLTCLTICTSIFSLLSSFVSRLQFTFLLSPSTSSFYWIALRESPPCFSLLSL